MKIYKRVEQIVNELKNNNEAITVDNIVIKSLFSVGGTLAGYEKEIQSYLNTLIAKDKIQSYKSYSNEVKQRVLEQFRGIKGLTEEESVKVLERIPKVMKATQKQQIKYNKILRTVKGLEQHKYAPELNKLHFKNGNFKTVAGKTTVKDAINSII